MLEKVYDSIYILSSASKVGSPTNHLGSGQQRDTDQGPFSLLTGGLYLMTDYLKFKNTDQHWTCFTKAGWARHATICWIHALHANCFQLFYRMIWMKRTHNIFRNGKLRCWERGLMELSASLGKYTDNSWFCEEAGSYRGEIGIHEILLGLHSTTHYTSQLFLKIMDICPHYGVEWGVWNWKIVWVCLTVYTQKGGGKMKDLYLHALWGHYHKYAHKL